MNTLDKNQILEEFTSCDWKQSLLDFQKEAYIAKHIPGDVYKEVVKSSLIRLLQYTFVLSIPILYLYCLPSVDGHAIHRENLGDFVQLIALFGFAFTYHFVKDKARYNQGATYSNLYFCRNILFSKHFLQKHIETFTPIHSLQANDLIMFFDKVVHNSILKNKDSLSLRLESLKLKYDDLKENPETTSEELLEITSQKSEVLKLQSYFTFLQGNFQDERSKIDTLEFFLTKFHGDLTPIDCDSQSKLDRLNSGFLSSHRR